LLTPTQLQEKSVANRQKSMSINRFVFRFSSDI